LYGRKTKCRTGSIDAHRVSPAIEKKQRRGSSDTHRISPAVSYGRKKNHEVIEHILSVSVRKSSDLESTTKSCFPSFVRGEKQKILFFF
jgi:hypothetical protein